MRRTTAASLLVALTLLAPDRARAQSGPPRATPAQVGIQYDIVAVRMPTPAAPSQRHWQDAFNMSLFIGPGAELVILHPDGSEELLFSAGPQASCVDPFVSYDGSTVYFSVFQDPEAVNPQRFLSAAPAHVWKIDLATRQATQLTTGNEMAWRDSANQINPRYAPYDVAPVELPDGRILFLSTRDNTFSVTGRWPAPAFWRMNPDGSNLERMEWFSMSGCQHPLVLKDGRIVWTHRHNAGRRNVGGHSYALMVADQDLSDIQSFAGMHARASAWHFVAELTGGDIVTTAYYHGNNFGHGALVRFPLDPRHPSGNDFGPVAQNPRPAQNMAYGVNDSYPRVGEQLVTPWSLTPYLTVLTNDEPAPLLPSGERAGKSTMPAAAPGGHMLFVWSSGECHFSMTPAYPEMKIAFAKDGWLLNHGDITVLQERTGYQYMHPRPLVPYQQIHGVARPARRTDTPNTGQHAVLPADGAFATTGTSSVYNRESHWPLSYTDAWSQNLVNNFAQLTAFHTVGQDTYAFPDNEIHAAQIVVDMVRVDARYRSLYGDFKSHNNGQQLWGVLGEIPVRKFDGQGQPIRDPQGNPDTSYEVRIPANVPFHHRLIDQNGLMLTAEQTWHSARPGERKNNCGGCHAHSTEKTPLDFALTAAAQPSYSITDFALQTPMVDQDAQGNPTVVVHPEKVRLVEYHRDVAPIFQAKCVSCHQGAIPAGGLDLADPNAWDTLAFKRDPAVPWQSGHQVTRYVRRHAATQSSLVWKVYGRRLDGRTNAERSDDWDYTGDVMPPPGSGVAPLTFEEKRTIALWVDLGCLVDMTPGRASVSDPFDDQMRPTLVLGGVQGDFNEHPLPPLQVSAYDLHSGLDAASLVVEVTPAGGAPGGNLAAGVQLQEGLPVSIALPALAPDQRHTIDVSVADQAGNVARRRLEVTPLSLRYSETPWRRNAWVELKVEGARPGEPVYFVGSVTGQGPGPIGFGGALQLDILAPIHMATVVADAAGTATRRYFLPAAMPSLVFHSQALVIRGSWGQLSAKTRPLWSELK